MHTTGSMHSQQDRNIMILATLHGTEQWRIQLWADWVAASQLRAGHGGATQTQGQIFTEILNFWPLFYIKIYKKLSASGGGGFAL